MYQTSSRNVKTNSLTRMSDFILKSAKNERSQYQHQTILISDRLELHAAEKMKNLLFSSRFETESSNRAFIIRNFEDFSSSTENFIITLDEISLYDRVLAINKKNEKCSKYRRIIEKKRFALHRIKLINCQIKKDVLYHDDQL